MKPVQPHLEWMWMHSPTCTKLAATKSMACVSRQTKRSDFCFLFFFVAPLFQLCNCCHSDISNDWKMSNRHMDLLSNKSDRIAVKYGLWNTKLQQVFLVFLLRASKGCQKSYSRGDQHLGSWDVESYVEYSNCNLYLIQTPDYRSIV